MRVGGRGTHSRALPTPGGGGRQAPSTMASTCARCPSWAMAAEGSREAHRMSVRLYGTAVPGWSVISRIVRRGQACSDGGKTNIDIRDGGFRVSGAQTQTARACCLALGYGPTAARACCLALGYGPTAAGPRNSIIARGRRPCRRNQSRDDSSASLRPSAAFDSTKIPTADTHHFLI